ncbi:LuxR C-terminal-related transcriptional regulator [Bacillus sp. 1P06AnD]|uniref:LuxR C-terminal-related transcriptional regulator n=1 Tax=Bacillus sp. 1P06AnD TaxID=3132208 RepID=UPI0039A0CD76
MNTIWLNSKTKVPSIIKMAINRERLYQLLDDGKATKITVVQAPAGYGKTTVLSQWMSRLGEPACWLSIDTLDNDPIRFLNYLIQTVSVTLENNVASRFSSLFTSHPQSPFELIIDALLNEISVLKENIHIVLDDYHLIEHPTIHDMMIRFVDYLPENIHLYMLSRSRIELPLERWRVKSWLTEIGIEQLCFTYEEIEQLFKKKNLLLMDKQLLQGVLAKTEGWAAGIQLASLSIAADEVRADRFDGTHPFVAEFLLKEIFGTLPLDTQHFLIQTSIFNMLEPEICDALTNRSDSYNLLLELAEKGIFTIRLSSKTPIFRYHQLFADALQTEMRNMYNKEQEVSLYQKAGDLLCERGDYISAIELVLQQQIYVLAESWITDYLVDIFTTGQTSTFVRWVDVMRKSKYTLPPEMLVMYTIALTSKPDLQKAQRMIHDLEQRHSADQWMYHPDNQGVVSILTTLKAYILIAVGDDKEQVAEIILNQLQKGRVSSRWDHIPMQYNQFEPKIFRTLIGSKGKFTPVEQSVAFSNFFRQTDFKEQNMMGFSYGVLAETMYEVNLLEEALQEIDGGLQYAYRFQDAGLAIPLYILKSRIYMAKKQFTSAQAVLDHALQEVTEWHWIRSLQAMKAYGYLLESDMPNAEKELFKTKRPDMLKVELGQELWLLVYARFLLATDGIQEALSIVIRVKEKASLEDQISTIIEASLLESLCCMKINRKESAFALLHKAMELGCAYGYKRIFIDEADIVRLLKQYMAFRKKDSNKNWQSVPFSYVEELVRDGDPIADKSMDGMLTPREMDVLKLLASGATNRSIAGQLYLSEGTIRVYLTNIYSKLDVQSRAQAILLAKEWGL